MDINERLNQVGDKITEASQWLENVSLANDTVLPDNDGSAGYETIKEVLDAGNGSEKSKKLKKLLAAAAIAVKQAKKEVDAVEPTSLAASVDYGASRVHAAYDTQIGRKTIDQAVDGLIDRQAVYAVHVCDKAIGTLKTTAKTMADVVVYKGLDKVVDVVGNAVATVFPPARAAIPFVKTIVKAAKPVVRKVIHQGIDQLAEHAKNFMKKAVAMVKNLAVSVKNKIANFLFG